MLRGGGDNTSVNQEEKKQQTEKILSSLVVEESSDSTPSVPSFTATAKYSDGTEELVTEKAVWSSSAESIATVNSGKVTLLSEGETVVSATYKDGDKSETSLGQRIKVSRENGEDGSSVKDKIIVHVPVSLGYEYVWAWNPTNTSDNYTGGAWGGQKMSDADGDGNYDYTLTKTVSAIIFNENRDGTTAGSGKTNDLYVTAGEWDYIGGKSGTEDKTGSSISSNFKYTEYKDSGTLTATITSEKNTEPKTNPNPDGALVSDWNELRIYQVMVSSFQDGDSSVGYGTGYGPGPHNGDLRGIINALDYIKGLGMNAVWMTPIFTSDGNEQLDSTGYFCSDYFNVDPKFGGNEVFKELVETAHEKGIAVILDGVFGHHRSSGISKASPKGRKPSGKSNPVNYPGSLDYYTEVAQYWIENYKIDGWRFDQCYQVGLGDGGKNCDTGGHNYWYEIRTAIKESAAKNGTKGEDWGTLGYTVGEHWNGDSANIQAGSINPGSAKGYGLQSCFDFPSRYRLVQMFAMEESKKISGTSLSNLDYVYSASSAKGYTHPEGYYPNLFLTNHDLVRFGNLVNWKYSENRSNSNYWKRHKVALASIAAYSGPITLYYGDEYGMMTDGYSGPGYNGWYNDNIARDAGKITGFSSDEQDLHDYVASLMTMRAENEVMWKGVSSTVKSENDFYVGKKTLDGNTVYFGINYNSSLSKSFSANGTDLLSGTKYSGTVTVPALSAVYVLAD